MGHLVIFSIPPSINLMDEETPARLDRSEDHHSDELEEREDIGLGPHVDHVGSDLSDGSCRYIFIYI